MTDTDGLSARPDILRPIVGDPRRARDLYAAVHRGEVERLHPGGYAATESLAGLDPRQRHVLRVHAAMPRLRPWLVVSHGSAAALHRLPQLGSPPERIHVTDPARVRPQSWNGVVKHAGPLLDRDIVVVDGLRVTSVARTAADIALSAPVDSAVVVLDSVLHDGLATKDDIRACMGGRPRARGMESAGRAVAFADALAQSPGESWARVLMHRMGAPTPILQRSFVDESGHVVGDVDFWFAEQGVVIEFDGFVKYSESRYLNGATPSQVVFDEKNREDRIRAFPEVRNFGRCVWSDLHRLTRFAAILRRAGVPLRWPP